MIGRNPRQFREVGVMGRLAPGATIEQADREIAAIAARVNRANGIDAGDYVGRAREVKADWLEAEVRLMVNTMYGAVIFVLLIACANVAKRARTSRT